jgi:hypothetical protein
LVHLGADGRALLNGSSRSGLGTWAEMICLSQGQVVC